MRNGSKYFLVRFKNATQNELIDWDTAKKYSQQVMEYFGSRLVWTSVENVIDPENDYIDQQNDADDERSNRNSSNQPSTSTAHNPPNDIEYDH